METREDFRPRPRHLVYGREGPACAALRSAVAGIRDASARKKDAQEAARVRNQWAADAANNEQRATGDRRFDLGCSGSSGAAGFNLSGGAGSSGGPEAGPASCAGRPLRFLTALAFAADPVESAALASRNRDPGGVAADRARAASEESVWALAAMASSAVAPARGSAAGSIRAALDEGLEMLRGATVVEAAELIRSGRTARQPDQQSVPPKSAARLARLARLAALAVCSALDVGLVVEARDGCPVPLLVEGSGRVAWLAACPARDAQATPAPEEARERISAWLAGVVARSSTSAGPVVPRSLSAQALRDALVAAGVPRPHPKSKADMAAALDR